MIICSWLLFCPHFRPFSCEDCCFSTNFLLQFADNVKRDAFGSFLHIVWKKCGHSTDQSTGAPLARLTASTSPSILISAHHKHGSACVAEQLLHTPVTRSHQNTPYFSVTNDVPYLHAAVLTCTAKHQTKFKYLHRSCWGRKSTHDRRKCVCHVCAVYERTRGALISRWKCLKGRSLTAYTVCRTDSWGGHPDPV